MKKLLLIFIGIISACSNERKEALSNHLKDSVAVQSVSTSEENPSSNTSPSSVFSTLVTRNILNKVEVSVPRAFKIMDAEMIVVKYPLKQPASFQVYTDEDATVNIAVEHTSNKATLQELPDIKEVFERQFNQPGIDFKKSEIKNINGREYIVIEMITPAMDTDVYNLMFVTSLEGRILIGTFNCTVNKMKEWRPIAEQILSSLRVKV